jgi:hypothetical protein
LAWLFFTAAIMSERGPHIQMENKKGPAQQAGPSNFE